MLDQEEREFLGSLMEDLKTSRASDSVATEVKTKNVKLRERRRRGYVQGAAIGESECWNLFCVFLYKIKTCEV